MAAVHVPLEHAIGRDIEHCTEVSAKEPRQSGEPIQVWDSPSRVSFGIQVFLLRRSSDGQAGLPHPELDPGEYGTLTNRPIQHLLAIRLLI